MHFPDLSHFSLCRSEGQCTRQPFQNHHQKWHSLLYPGQLQGRANTMDWGNQTTDMSKVDSVAKEKSHSWPSFLFPSSGFFFFFFLLWHFIFVICISITPSKFLTDQNCRCLGVTQIWNNSPPGIYRLTKRQRTTGGYRQMMFYKETMRYTIPRWKKKESLVQVFSLYLTDPGCALF